MVGSLNRLYVAQRLRAVTYWLSLAVDPVANLGDLGWWPRMTLTVTAIKSTCAV